MSGPASPVVYLQIGAAFGPMGEIQQTLWAHRDPMREVGVLYVRRYPMEDVHASASLRRDEATLRAMPRAAGAWERVAKRARTWPGLSVISHGSLALATKHDVRDAARTLQPAEIHVVFTTVDLLSQAYAHWHHLLVGGADQPFVDFADELARNATTGPASAFRSMQDPVRALAPWSTVVPAERIHVIVPAWSASRYASPWQQFCRTAGIDEAPTVKPAPVTWLDPEDAEILRRVNGALAGRLHGAPYDRAVKKLFAGTVLSRSARALRHPRVSSGAYEWFTTRADETRASMVDAGYHIVGDLADLRPARERGEPPAGDTSPDHLLGRALEAGAQVIEQMRDTRNRVERAEQQLARLDDEPAPVG